MAAVFQHNQPAAIAVAPVVGRLPVADIIIAGLLSVFLANPLRVSVAAYTVGFSGGGGRIPMAMTAKMPTPIAAVAVILFSIALLLCCRRVYPGVCDASIVL